MITEAEVLALLPQRDGKPHGFLANYVHYAREINDAHLSYHLGAGLCLLAMTMPETTYFPFSTKLYGNVFALLVGTSSDSRKGVAISLMRSMMEEAGEVKKLIANTPGSTEVMVDNIMKQPQQCLFIPEFGAFLVETEKGYRVSMKTKLNDVADSVSLSRDLAGKQKKGEVQLPCENARVSLIGGVDPGYLERHSEQVDWASGFFARFLIFHAKRERKTTRPDINRAANKRLRLVQELENRAFTLGDYRVGNCRGWNEEAGAIWDSWSNSIDNQPGPRELVAANSRAQGLAVKLALLMGADLAPKNKSDWWVTPAALFPALSIIGLHMKSVASVWARLAPTRYLRDRRAMLDAFGEAIGVPVRYGDALHNSKLDGQTAKAVIGALCEEGFLKRSQVPGSSSEHYERTAAVLQGNKIVHPPGSNGAEVPGRTLELPPGPTLALVPPVDDDEGDQSGGGTQGL